MKCKELLATVNGHELKHMLDSRQKKGTTESGANRFGDQSHNALSDEIGGGSSGDYASHQNWTSTHTKDGSFDRGNTLAGGARDVDAMSIESMTRYSYNLDTGRDADQDFAYIPNLPGDAVQSISQSKYSGVGLALSGAAFATGATLASPLVIGGLAIGGVSMTKSYLDWSEGKQTTDKLGVDIGFELGSHLPGKLGLGVEGASFIYDVYNDLEKGD
ncbi:hypothetical protein HOH87_05420 [bacterium]|nr:hypothetical protein [bacterium]